jgi:N-terminal acetyltransferase 2
MKKLSREYGYSAVGVYFALSALDFPFCFLAVRMLGTDRIGRWEHNVVEVFFKVVPRSAVDKAWEVIAWPFPAKEVAPGSVVDGAVAGDGQDWGVDEAEKNNTGDNASKFMIDNMA